MKKIIIISLAVVGLLFVTAFANSKTQASNNHGYQWDNSPKVWNGQHSTAGWCSGSYSSTRGCRHWFGRLMPGHSNRCVWSAQTNNEWPASCCN